MFHISPGVLPGANEYRASVDLMNGTFHDIVLEYREEDGAASIQVGSWEDAFCVDELFNRRIDDYMFAMTTGRIRVPTVRRFCCHGEAIYLL